jgi:hypothetical protein
MTADKSLAQRLGPLFGAFYVVIGVFGFFVTGFDAWVQNTPDTLLGFSINPFANLVHIGIGALLLWAGTRRSAPLAEGAIMGVGLFFIVAFAIGVTGQDNLTILSMHGESDVQNIHHIVSGVALLTIGLLSSGQTQARLKRRGLA